MALSNVTYSCLTSSNDAIFEEFYNIYAEALHVSERKSRSQISAMVERSDYLTLLSKENNSIIGFSMIFCPDGEEFCLAEYMGVLNTERNLGYGTGLFRETANELAKRGIKAVLIEADSENEKNISESERSIRYRRRNLYSRLGSVTIDKLFYQLPLKTSVLVGPPPEMFIMVYFFTDLPLMKKSQVEHWLKVVYEKVYDCSPLDPRIKSMMESVPDPVVFI